MKIYESNLDERTLKFAKEIINLCKTLPKNAVNFELIRQLVRAGTSIGANYSEANDALSKKDFIYRMRISRKEAKETQYWLSLIDEANPEFKKYLEPFLQESTELIKIFSSIIEKSK
jgi:four helix bundle protein